MNDVIDQPSSDLFVAVDRLVGLVPVAVQSRVPGVRAARDPPGRGWLGPVRVRRSLCLGRGARLDRDRLLHRLRRLRQFRAVVPPAPAAQPAHVLRVPGPPDHHDHDQFPDGRATAPAQSDHGKRSERAPRGRDDGVGARTRGFPRPVRSSKRVLGDDIRVCRNGIVRI